MRLPADWSAEKASGWWSLHHLVHDECGFRTGQAYDLWASEGPFGEAAARQLVYGHRCDPDDNALHEDDMRAERDYDDPADDDPDED